MPRIGDIAISAPGDYANGAYYVEQYGYYNTPEPMWAVPAWEEHGLADLAGPFTTQTAAQAALDSVKDMF